MRTSELVKKAKALRPRRLSCSEKVTFRCELVRFCGNAKAAIKKARHTILLWAVQRR